jgi:hypothetical protein
MGTTYLWTSCEIVLPTHLGKGGVSSGFCPQLSISLPAAGLGTRGSLGAGGGGGGGPGGSEVGPRVAGLFHHVRDDIKRRGVIRWKSLVTSRSVMGWILVTLYGVLVGTGWLGWRREWSEEKKKREEEREGLEMGAIGVMGGIRHWDGREARDWRDWDRRAFGGRREWERL